MRFIAVAATLALAATTASAAVHPIYEHGQLAAAPTTIDGFVRARLAASGIEPAPPCSDEVFVRRSYLDVIGTLPTPDEALRFVGDRRPDKRAVLIDELLDRAEFADYWSLKWCDLLRVKAEYPINLWPNAVQAYHRWIRDAIRSGMTYDRFARELLTSSGSNFRVPQVNFYRAVDGKDPAVIADAVALTFMGARARSWPAERRDGMAAFFSRVAFKPTAEWKEEIVLLDPSPSGPLRAVLPDGSVVVITPDEDPRRVFADWLVAPDNPWFARAIANRVWSWLLGRGLVEEPDDIRPDNPPSHPELLDYLSAELVGAGFDLRHLYRLILESATYQQSPVARSDRPEAEALFAHYPVRRLDAEVLIDALDGIFSSSESYTSRIPEPYTFVPEHERTILLADGSTTSQFLEMFGRPPRDTGLESERSVEPTDAQRLHLLNSTHIQEMIDRSRWLRQLVAERGRDAGRAIEEMYLTILSRRPRPDEVAGALDYLSSSGLEPAQAAADLAWALINTKEFLYRH